MAATKGEAAATTTSPDRSSSNEPILNSRNDDAATALQAEKDLRFADALRLYPRAVGWSVFFSIGVIMLAFDPQLLGSLYAMPAFQRDFGEAYGDAVGCCVIYSCLSRHIHKYQVAEFTKMVRQG